MIISIADREQPDRAGHDRERRGSTRRFGVRGSRAARPPRARTDVATSARAAEEVGSPRMRDRNDHGARCGRRGQEAHGYDAPVLPPVDGDDWLGLTDAALPIGDMYEWCVRPDCGAVVLFSGTVRDHADGSHRRACSARVRGVRRDGRSQARRDRRRGAWLRWPMSGGWRWCIGSAGSSSARVRSSPPCRRRTVPRRSRRRGSRSTPSRSPFRCGSARCGLMAPIGAPTLSELIDAADVASTGREVR